MNKIPNWILKAADEIDLVFGENNIADKVAKIIFDKYEAARQSVQRAALLVRILNAICYGTTIATFLWLLFGGR